MMDPVSKKIVILAGRAKLRAFLETARSHGTLYHAARHGKGAAGCVSLYTIATDERGPALVKLWPNADLISLPGSYSYGEVIDTVAQDWGFSFLRRAFVRRGGGTEVTFDVVEGLARLAEIPDPLAYVNGIRREAL